MKKIIIPILIILFFGALQAQEGSSLRLGIKAGVGSTNIDVDELKILGPGGLEQLGLAVKDAKYGFHAGILLRARFNKFLFQPEFLFNSNRVDYTVDDLTGGNIVSTVRDETYQYLDIPVLLGFKWGPLRLQAGPVGHVFLDSNSEFFDLANIDYRQEFDDLTVGWQGNVGLDIWNLMLDFRYEGNFTKFGTHLNFAGKQYEFDDAPSRFLVSVGFLFGGK